MTHSTGLDATAPVRRRLVWRHLDWPVVLWISAVHLGCLLAPFYFSASGLWVAVFFIFLTGPIGITLCYHRLLTHRSFKSPKWFEYFLTVCGCMAGQGAPIQWVGTHRIHHRYSDEHDDPHSPTHGFTWAHVFWCLHKDQGGMPWSAANAAQDLCRDSGIRVINRFFYVPQLGAVLACYLGGSWAAWMGWETSGLSWVLWGTCVRTVFVYHVTWFVNSAAHTWGYQNFNTGDRSTNLWWLALLSFGEGWHNNHHGDQRCASHGRRWFEIDATYWMIRLLGVVGLARDIALPRKPLPKSKTSVPAVPKPITPSRQPAASPPA